MCRLQQFSNSDIVEVSQETEFPYNTDLPPPLLPRMQVAVPLNCHRMRQTNGPLSQDSLKISPTESILHPSNCYHTQQPRKEVYCNNGQPTHFPMVFLLPSVSKVLTGSSTNYSIFHKSVKMPESSLLSNRQ